VAAAEGRLPPDRVVVRVETASNVALVVEWDRGRWPVVTPRLVRLCVDEGLRRGWPDRLASLSLRADEVAALRPAGPAAKDAEQVAAPDPPPVPSPAHFVVGGPVS
jgi:hypothetical protein